MTTVQTVDPDEFTEDVDYVVGSLCSPYFEDMNIDKTIAVYQGDQDSYHAFIKAVLKKAIPEVDRKGFLDIVERKKQDRVFLRLLASLLSHLKQSTDKETSFHTVLNDVIPDDNHLEKIILLTATKSLRILNPLQHKQEYMNSFNWGPGDINRIAEQDPHRFSRVARTALKMGIETIRKDIDSNDPTSRLISSDTIFFWYTKLKNVGDVFSDECNLSFLESSLNERPIDTDRVLIRLKESPHLADAILPETLSKFVEYSKKETYKMDWHQEIYSVLEEQHPDLAKVYRETFPESCPASIATYVEELKQTGEEGEIKKLYNKVKLIAELERAVVEKYPDASPYSDMFSVGGQAIIAFHKDSAVQQNQPKMTIFFRGEEFGGLQVFNSVANNFGSAQNITKAMLALVNNDELSSDFVVASRISSDDDQLANMAQHQINSLLSSEPQMLG